MPESTCLHIQARESDPVRVVDLPGNSVRVGRAAYCDVRLADPDLADEECRLRRRGGAWQLVPVAPGGAVRLDGRPVEGPTAVLIGATFAVGAHTLTLRLSSTSPLWADRPVVVNAAAARPGVEPTGVELAEARREGWDSPPGDAHDRWSHAQKEAKRWETRWRAAGEKLRAAPAAGAAVPPIRPGVPTVSARPVRPEAGGLGRDPVARRSARPHPAMPPGPAASRPLSPPAAGSRPAGYVSPAATNARREAVRPSGWSDSPAPRRPIPPDPVRLTRPEPAAKPFPQAVPVAREPEPGPSPASGKVGASRPDPGTLLNGLGISRIEHDDLDTLISRFQTPDVGDDPATPGVTPTGERSETVDVMIGLPGVEGERPAAPNYNQLSLPAPADPGAEYAAAHRGRGGDLTDEATGWIDPARTTAPDVLGEGCTPLTRAPHRVEAEVSPPALAVLAVDEDEGEEWDEPETARPVLGTTRRRARVTRPEPEAPEWVTEPDAAEVATAERTGPDTFRAGATRWVAHRPRPGDAGEETPGTETSADDTGGWSYQVPFVTDTNLVEPSGGAGRASAFAGPPSEPPRRGWSDPFPEAAGDAGRGADRAARDWPTVGEILAAQGVRPRGSATATASATATPRRPEPTAAREPRQWRLPIWLAWVPGSTLVLGVGLVGLSGAWGWSRDGYDAGLVTERVSAAEPSKVPLPPGVVPPGGSWWTTSANHLVAWAAYLDRTGDDPERAGEARRLLDRAAALAPLNPSVRYALARPAPGEPPVAPADALARSLGQSRDVPSLAWAGRALLAAGKPEAALRAFREALEMAARADLERAGVPAYLEDAQVRRYALPTEDQVGAVVRAMSGSGAWSYKDWAGALPRGTAAAAVAARALRESNSPDAVAALDAALAEGEAEAANGSPASTGPVAGRAAAAVRLAAWAEALAMKQRWAEARDRYRQAVDLMPVDALRRAWCVNLADLASRLGEDQERQRALEDAKVADLKDEVTRRAVDLQRAPGAVARRPAVAGGSEARR